MTNKLVISLLAILVIVIGFFGYVVSSNKGFTETKTFEREITKVETISETDDIDSIETIISRGSLADIPKVNTTPTE